MLHWPTIDRVSGKRTLVVRLNWYHKWNQKQFRYNIINVAWA